MRTPYALDRPSPRRSGSVSPWLEVAAWLVAFGLLLAAPCAPPPPQGHATHGAPLSARRGDAPARP